MSELISRNDAAQAFIDGKQVEFLDKTGQWRSVIDNTVLKVFLDHTDFRLKPHTITLNNIEIPAPFEPKEGETYWCFSTQTVIGYGHNVYESERADRRFINMGAWRTEEEIKQVVSALRSIFKRV